VRATPRVWRPAATGPPSSLVEEVTLEVVTVFGFKGSQGGVKQPAIRHDDDVEARRDLVTTENFSNQSFSSIPLDRASQLLRGGDPQPAERKLVGQDEEGTVAAVNPGAMLVDLLELLATTNVFVALETGHGF